MSVVNRMLKDLEQRSNQTIHEADYVPLESSAKKSKKLTVGVLVVVIILAFATWLLLPTQTAPILNQGGAPELSAIVLEKPVVVAEDADDLIDNSKTQVLLSELDQATLNTLQSAKQSEKIRPVSVTSEKTPSQTVKLSSSSGLASDLDPDLAPAKQAALVVSPSTQAQESEPSVFNVSSSSQSVSDSRMLEQRIQLSLNNGDTAAALRDLNNLVALEPRNGNARKRLASLEFAQNNPKRAAFLLDQGIKLSPEDSSMRLMLARLLFREDRNAQALSLLNDHPQNVVADNDLLSFRAALAEKQKDYSRSLQDYTTLLQRQPDNARWMLGLAISQDKQELHADAIANYKKVKSSKQLSTQVVSFIDERLAVLVGS